MAVFNLNVAVTNCNETYPAHLNTLLLQQSHILVIRVLKFCKRLSINSEIVTVSSCKGVYPIQPKAK